MSDNNYAGRTGLSAVFAAIKSAINEKVSKEVGKGLSTNDYTDHDKNLVNTMEPYLDTVYIGASGNPIVVQAQDAPVLGLDVALEPIQDLHGYDHPWVGGAGKNLFAIDEAFIKTQYPGYDLNTHFVRNVAGVDMYVIMDSGNNPIAVRLVGTATVNVSFNIGKVILAKNVTYRISPGIDTGNYNVFARVSGPNDTFTYNYSSSSAAGTTFQINADDVPLYCNLRVGEGLTIDKTFYPWLMLESETDKSFTPWKNECPISGRTETSVQTHGKNQLPLNLATIKTLNPAGTWNGNTYTFQGLTFKVNTDNANNITGITVNGTSSALTEFIITRDMDNSCPFIGDILNGCTGGSGDTYMIRISDLVTTSANCHNGDTAINITASGKWSCQIHIKSGVTLSNKAFYPMIRMAGTSATFELYKAPKSETISFGQTVYNGDFDFNNGSGDSKTNKFVLNGSEGINWGITNNTTNNIQVLYANIANLLTGVKTTGRDQASIIFNIFKTRTSSAIPWAVGLATIDSNNGAWLNMVFPLNTFADSAAFNTWLASNNVEFTYELASPIELTLTPAVLDLLKGYNYITGDGNMGLAYIPESILPTPPTTDGVYKLTCTVSGGVPTFSWESDL